MTTQFVGFFAPWFGRCRRPAGSGAPARPVRPPHRRRPLVEPLESRHAPAIAGATIVGGVLAIQGDFQDDAIQLISFDIGGGNNFILILDNGVARSGITPVFRSDGALIGGANTNQIVIAGGDGNDVITVALLTGFPATAPVILAGQNGSDVLIGRNGTDVLLGENGNDTLVGLAGNDILVGGANNDVLVGGDGEDILVGEAGNDVLAGEAGHDSMDGGDGNDALDGGDGNDALLGGADDDTLLGGPGHDALLGGPGNDLLFGGDGNDTLLGEAGGDSVDGGTGDDVIFP
jgi:Ca2+-binding RTX toxin-like protein